MSTWYRPVRDSSSRERHQIVRMIRSVYDLPAGGDSAIYLLHFVKDGVDFGIGHAGHYLGCSAALGARIDAHRRGEGARLTKALWNAGGGFVVALAFKLPRCQGRFIERRLKDRHSKRQLCPVCVHASKQSL